MSFDINPVAVVVALVIQQALGFIWYGVVFREAWMRRMGKTAEDIGTGGADAAQFISVVCSAVAALALAVMVASMDDPSPATGLLTGLVVGVGFAGSATLMNAGYEQRDQPVTWMFISYQVVSLAIMGAVLGAWQ